MQEKSYPNPGTRYGEDLKRKVVESAMAGKSVSVLTKEYNVSQPTIARWLRDFNLAGGGVTKTPDKTEIQVLKAEYKKLLAYTKRLERVILERVLRKESKADDSESIEILFKDDN